VNPAPEPERRLVDYLLGRLPDADRVALEERLFEDGSLDDQLVATTDELIHAYLRGELAPEDRQPFESHFLAAPDHRERLDFMRHLLAVTSRPAASPAAPRGRWWLVAAAAVLVVGAALVFTRGRDTAPPQTTAQATPTVAATPRPSSPMATAQAAVLPGHGHSTPIGVPEHTQLVRVPPGGATPVDVAVSERAHVVRLEVTVDDDTSPSFDASIHDADGAEVWRAEGLAPRVGDPLLLDVPAQFLRQGAYVLRIVGEALREGAPRESVYRLSVSRGKAATPPPAR